MSSDDDELPPSKKKCQRSIGSYFSPVGAEKKNSSCDVLPLRKKKKLSGSQVRKNAKKKAEEISHLTKMSIFTPTVSTHTPNIQEVLPAENIPPESTTVDDVPDDVSPAANRYCILFAIIGPLLNRRLKERNPEIR